MSQQPWPLYRAFGLTLQSSLPLPELHQLVSMAAAPADVIVSQGAASPPVMPEASEVAPGVWAGSAKFWMDVPNIAQFLVCGGTEMVINAHSGAREADVRAFLLGSAMGALLHQRGYLPLHASAVEWQGKVVAFIAPSGGGKSTLAMHLQHLGHRVVCDDICAVDLRNGRARVWPGLRNLKLWRASLDAINVQRQALESVLEGMDKYRLPISNPAEDRPMELAAVVMLQWGNVPELTPISGAEAIGALIANTFRGHLVAPMQRQAAHWQQCLVAARSIAMYVLTRPRAIDRLGEASALVSTLLERDPART